MQNYVASAMRIPVLATLCLFAGCSANGMVGPNTEADMSAGGGATDPNPGSVPGTKLAQGVAAGSGSAASCAGYTGPCSTQLTAIPLTGCALSDYSAPITVGTDQVLNLLMDSGSTSIGVADAACTNCTGVTPEYTPGATAAAENRRVSATYGSGGWSGVTYRDDVTVNSAIGSVPMSFAAITSQKMTTSGRNFFSPSYCSGVAKANPNQGIFGLANAGIALAGTDTYLDQLKALNKVADAFSFQACDIDGRMWFGGYDPSSMTAAPQFTPMRLTPGYYEVSLTEVEIGGQRTGLSAATFGTSIADTGTSIMILPQAIFTSLARTIEADSAFQSLFGTGFFTSGLNCSPPSQPSTKAQLDAALPKMSLIFPNVSGQGSISVELPATESYLTPSFDTQGQLCYLPALEAGSLGSGGPSIILGNSLMHSQIVIFDRANQQLGFAPQTGCP